MYISVCVYIYIYIYIYIFTSTNQYSHRKHLLVQPTLFSLSLSLYIYIYIYTRVSWKVHRLTKILSLNVTVSKVVDRSRGRPEGSLFNNWLIRLVGRVFVNGPGGLGSIPGRVILKTLKMVFDSSLLNTHHYKVCIKGKVEQSWESNSVPNGTKWGLFFNIDTPSGLHTSSMNVAEYGS